jgi:hypothetical protein
VKPRVTINLTPSGELEIWLNPQGRDLLVRELQNLNEEWEHFHMAPFDLGEVELQTIPYRSTDTLISRGKVLFRRDEWDRKSYPQLFDREAR